MHIRLHISLILSMQCIKLAHFWCKENMSTKQVDKRFSSINVLEEQLN